MPKLVVAVVAVVVVAAVAFHIVNGVLNAKYRSAEEWRGTMQQACIDCELDPQWTDALLALMVIESGADPEVSSVKGVEGDVMQAAESNWVWIITDGWPEHDIAPETPKASIYAGVYVFEYCLDLWDDYLGEITPQDSDKIQLMVQGYNFGADGWFAWCKENGITAYTVEIAQRYSDTQLPEGLKGTPTHAQKWLEAYEKIRADLG